MNCEAAQFDTVAAITCQKPAGETAAQCFARNRDRPALCRGHDKCRLAEMTSQQMAYVLHPIETESYLKACPGSGKTESVAIRAAYLLGAKTWTSSGIAFLTFTNNAADVIRHRIARTGRVTSFYPHFVGTFDSWIHGYLLNPFGHHITGFPGKAHDRSVNIVDNGSSATFLHAYKTAQALPKSGPVFAHEYHYDKDDCLVFASGDRTLDAARRKIALSADLATELREIKKAFWKAGFATYADAETICLTFLRKAPKLAGLIAQRFPFLIVDECQDLAPGQLALLDELRKAGSKLHFVGDRHQAIYSFRDADAAQVIAFLTDRNFVELPLTANFRSLQAIVDFCGKLVPQGAINGVAPHDQASSCVYLTYEKPDDLGALVSRFEALLAQRKIDPSQSVVLARGAALLARLDPSYAEDPRNLAHEFARALYLWKTRRFELRDEALKFAGSVMAETFYAGEATKASAHHLPASFGLAPGWRLLLAQVLDAGVADPALTNFDQTWSAWAALAKGKLPGMVHALKPEFDAGTVPSFSAPKGLAQKKLADSFSSPGPADGKIKCSTIHKVKGQTVDAVLVVSAPDKRSQGGHWDQWIDPTLEGGEFARFAYVASSRPRLLLAWAIRAPKEPEETAKFGGLGLTLVP